MTELVLEFEVENPELPLEMDRTGLSFFKASAKNYSPEWYEELYTKKKSVIKTYSWSFFYQKPDLELKQSEYGEINFLYRFRMRIWRSC